MRLTFPNPLGPPISLDTDHISPLLPTTSRLPSTSRRAPLRVILVVATLVLLLIWHPSPPLPPSYHEERKVERNLQWLYQGESYEGRNGRYLKFESPQPSGFNHQLQTVLLQHHLALLSNRSFAYDPLVQEESGLLPFAFKLPPWRSTTVPLSALIASVISGFEKLYDVPRAVPYRSYRGFCSSYRETVYQLKDEDHPEGNLEVSSDGQTRIHQLQALLAGSEAKCLRIKGRIFDDDFFSSETLLQTYPSFSQSPVLRHFSLSPTVLSIVNRVMPEIAPESAPYDLERVSRAVSTDGVKPGLNWKHILALHLRHGDEWAQACHQKGIDAAPFVGWSKIPEFPGNENVPPPVEMTEAARLGLYRAKCLPETLDIIARARRMRKNHPFVRTVYILADEVTPWAEEVKMWLLSEGWEKVWIGQRDIWPTWQEREIGVGVDMEVARRSGVFVGNGFSTTSSNIALLRARDGIHPDLTQFW